MADDIETTNISSPEGQAVESSNALDELFKQSTEETPAEEPAAAEPKPSAEPSAATTPDVKSEVTPAAQPDAKPEPTTTPAAAKDALDEVQLPPYSKPKTGEAFDKVKSIAREQLGQRDAEIARLSKELSDREEKLKALPTPEQQKQVEALTKEVEELRNFRRASDIENDPGFKSEYDGKIDANNNLILAKLAEAGMSPEQIDAAKKLGVENVDWDPLLPKLSPALRHLISAKLGANVELRDAKAAAVDAARKEPSKFETQRREVQARTLTETANSFLTKMSWTAEKQVPANATPEQKAEIDAHNKTAKEAQALIQTALKDYSPETFAELAVGTAAAHKFKADFLALKATSEAAAAKFKTDLDSVTKERDAFKSELDKIKKAGRTHVRQGSGQPAPVVDPFSTNGSDALDKLRNEIAG